MFYISEGGFYLGIGKTYHFRTIRGEEVPYVQIEVKDNVDDEEINLTIRHEVLRLFLKMCECKSDDDTAIFKILCNLFNEGFAKELTGIEAEIFDLAGHYMSTFLRSSSNERWSRGMKSNFVSFLFEIGSREYTESSQLMELNMHLEISASCFIKTEKVNMRNNPL